MILSEEEAIGILQGRNPDFQVVSQDPTLHPGISYVSSVFHRVSDDSRWKITYAVTQDPKEYYDIEFTKI